MKKILFLAANPKTTTSLQLRTEANKIHDSLQKAGAADKFQLIDKWAVDSDTLRRTLLDEKPDIVHFSGHGTGAEGLVLVGQDDKPRPATGDALASLFKIVNEIKPVRCVLLNACYAEEQARAIFRHIDNVIGMRRQVKDDAAIAFSVGFYDGFARQLPIRTAFDLGCTAIQFELASFSQGTRKAIVVLDEAKEILEPIPDHRIPILFSKESDAIASTSVQTESFSQALKDDGVSKEEALKQYRELVKKFLADRELTPIDNFQLATLASMLGLSETEVNQIRKEEQHRIEQARENYKRILIQTIDKGYPIKKSLRAELTSLQHSLGLHDEDVDRIEQPLIEHKEEEYQRLQKKWQEEKEQKKEFASERGIDYTRLQNLLKAGKWQEADLETVTLMCEVMGRQKEGWLSDKEVENFPCIDLHTIDRLWVKHSKGRFGFSIQKKIWRDCGSPSNYDATSWGKFGNKLGWSKKGFMGVGDWKGVKELTFDSSAPLGHLPGGGVLWAGWSYGVQFRIGFLGFSHQDL